MLERLGGDEELMAEVTRLFVEDCPARLAAIRAAIDAADAQAIRTTAHALKGAAGNLSARGLFESAQTLERLGAESRLDAVEAAWRRLSAEATHVMDTLCRDERSGSKGFTWTAGFDMYHGISDVPEPGKLALFGLGAAGWFVGLRGRRTQISDVIS